MSVVNSVAGTAGINSWHHCCRCTPLLPGSRFPKHAPSICLYLSVVGTCEHIHFSVIFVWDLISLFGVGVCVGVCPLNPTWLQPYLKHPCPDNVQNHEKTCLCKLCCRSTPTHKLQLQGRHTSTQNPLLQNGHILAFVLPIDTPTLELRCCISSDTTCHQICTDWLDGRMCLIMIRISDFFNPLFNYTTSWKKLTSFLTEAD